MGSRLRMLAIALIAIAVPAMLLAIWMAFAYAPDEKIMGPVQRIFYFHVPSAIVTFTSVFVLLGTSIAYLWTRKSIWDEFSRACAEIGLLFCTIVLVTGPIWAKPAWGVWWTWEARLTTTLVLWLLLAACLAVRGYSEDRDVGARLAAVLGIIAAADVPIIYRAVHWWRGQHPVMFAPGKKTPMDPAMLRTFLVCLGVFMLLFVILLVLRVAVASLEDRTHTLVESTGETT